MLNYLHVLTVQMSLVYFTCHMLCVLYSAIELHIVHIYAEECMKRRGVRYVRYLGTYTQCVFICAVFVGMT
jgi:hypothetical protein